MLCNQEATRNSKMPWRLHKFAEYPPGNQLFKKLPLKSACVKLYMIQCMRILQRISQKPCKQVCQIPCCKHHNSITRDTSARLKTTQNKAMKYVLDKQLRIYFHRLSPSLERTFLLFPSSFNLNSDNPTESNLVVHTPPIPYYHVKIISLYGFPIFAF